MNKEDKKKLTKLIELYYWRNPSRPSPLASELNREFKSSYTDQDILAIWGDEKIRNYLFNRGVQPPDIEGIGLSERQMEWIDHILDPSIAHLPMSMKMKTFGISWQTHAAWMQNELFADTLRIRGEKQFADARVLVLQGLASNAVDNKDFRSQKLYLEMTGDYSPRSQVNVNHTSTELRKFIHFIIDVLQSELEGEQLLRIVSRLEQGFAAIQSSSQEVTAKVSHLNMLEARSSASKPLNQLEQDLLEASLISD